MPGAICHESPPSSLLNSAAGSTPQSSWFLRPPGSSDQILTSARPSSFGNAGADFVSLKVLPMSVDRSTFIPKNGLQFDAYSLGVPRVSIRVEYTGVPGPNGPRSENFPRDFEPSATNAPFLVPIISTTLSATVILRKRLGETSRHLRRRGWYRPRRGRARFQ